MILIVDDEQAVLASLRLLFQHQGWESTRVKSPPAALDFIQAQRPDLVLLDMNFTPDTSGREGLDLLRKIIRHDPTIPVVLITGWASIELAIEGMKAGARDFIPKPWKDEQLLQTLGSWLKDTDAAAPDARRLSDRVMARVPQTRQRGRWWPLPRG